MHEQWEEVLPGVWCLGHIPVSEMEHIAIEFRSRLEEEEDWTTLEGRHKIYAKYDWIDHSGTVDEQAKSKQGQGEERREAGSPDTCRGWV